MRSTPRDSGGLSVVVPTRHEAANIDPLVDRIERAAQGELLEIIFVDDSDDSSTIDAIEAVKLHANCHIQVVHRPVGQRHGGLGGAVVEGLRQARGAWTCVMDADLQHPPEVIPRLLTSALQRQADIVVASRYCGAGEAGGLNAVRAAISHGFTAAAQLMFRGPLRAVTDPMSGYFLVRNSALNIEVLHPRGFKILLEILVRHPGLMRAEVDYQFAERHAEESKASLREGFRFLAHILELRMGTQVSQMGRFLAVGTSGIVVNLILLLMLTELFGLHYLASVAIATQGSSVWNFGFTESWVFSARRQSGGRAGRLLKFMSINNTALLARGPMIVILTSVLAMHYALSTLLSLAILSLIRYVVSDSWIWGRNRQLADRRTSYDYSVHDIITIRSEVKLPELEAFMSTQPLDNPMLNVRIGTKAEIRRLKSNSDAREQTLVYDEGLSVLGFAIGVSMGESIDIVASSLLRKSPHVLYTNVVEPVLRWTFVKHGYALIHGACIAFDQDAYLVTARTDTGKTTTLLRMLDRQRRATDTAAFLSDDLTLLAPDGTVLTYPKPLTISHHTTAAINQPLLTRRERLTLPLQSRLHSRGGRRFALLLAASHLPMATINAIVQWMVPPPKYHVQRLVPGVKLAQKAKLAGMFVIERGGVGEVPLNNQESLDILMSNCEDAYGFPPYESLKGFLHQAGNIDLRDLEREIVAQALTDLPAELFRSTTMDWSTRIPVAVLKRSASPRVERLREVVTGFQDGFVNAASGNLSPMVAADMDTYSLSEDD